MRQMLQLGVAKQLERKKQSRCRASKPLLQCKYAVHLQRFNCHHVHRMHLQQLACSIIGRGRNKQAHHHEKAPLYLQVYIYAYIALLSSAPPVHASLQIWVPETNCHPSEHLQSLADSAAMMSSEGGATVIHMDDGKAPAPAAPAAAASSSSSYATAPSGGPPSAKAGGGGGLPLLLRSGAEGFRRCLAVVDLLLRVAAVGPTLAAAIATGTADERLSVFTEFFQFHARFDDFRAFTFFVAANAVAAGYLVLSLPFACAGVLRPAGAAGAGVRLLLLACDTAVMALLAAAGAAAAAVVYVAHWGSRRAGWAPICMQFHGFCQRTSGAVVASFLAVLVFLVLIFMAAAAIRRR